jgi:hypothetical protein
MNAFLQQPMNYNLVAFLAIAPVVIFVVMALFFA